MSIALNAIAAAAAAATFVGSAGLAGAQPYYGYGQLPPAPYEVYGGGAYVGGCGGDRFTLLGAHAGVTVLGVDLGAGVGLSVPTGYCGVAQTEQFEPRPYAPPEEPAPAAYGPPPTYPQYAPPPVYAYQGYASQGYSAQSYGPPAYPSPCGCGAGGW